MIGAAAVAFFVAAVLILLVFRLAFGRRLRMPGGRARQMRLGIVDAFDLDRQRQLVIVRRDNIEHLVMIGGPNDILIESQIIRTEARPRDKDMRGEPAYVQGPAPKQHTEPRLMPEPQPAALEDYSVQDIPQPRERADRGGPPPSRRGGAPGKMPSVRDMPPAQPEFAGRPQGGARQGQQPPPPPPGQEAPAYMRWPSRQAAAPQPMKQPVRQRPPGPQPAPAPRNPAPQQQEPADAWPPAPSVEGLESLEEEMAKLLGRGPGGKS